LTTKIGALVDALGNLIAFVLVPGQRHDVNLVDKLMNGVACGAFLGDKAFDPNKVREFLARNGAEAGVESPSARTMSPIAMCAITTVDTYIRGPTA
jgi:hypothetical protein